MDVKTPVLTPYNHIDGGVNAPPAWKLMQAVSRGLLWLAERGGIVDLDPLTCTISWAEGSGRRKTITVNYSKEDPDEVLCAFEEAIRQAKLMK